MFKNLGRYLLKNMGMTQEQLLDTVQSLHRLGLGVIKASLVGKEDSDPISEEATEFLKKLPEAEMDVKTFKKILEAYNEHVEESFKKFPEMFAELEKEEKNEV